MVVVMFIGITSMFGNGAPENPMLYCIPLYNSVQSMSGIFSFHYNPLYYRAITLWSNLDLDRDPHLCDDPHVQQRKGYVLKINSSCFIQKGRALKRGPVFSKIQITGEIRDYQRLSFWYLSKKFSVYIYRLKEK